MKKRNEMEEALLAGNHEYKFAAEEVAASLTAEPLYPEETKHAVEEKYHSDEQQVASASSSPEQLPRLNRTLLYADLWKPIILGQSIGEVPIIESYEEALADTAVVEEVMEHAADEVPLADAEQKLSAEVALSDTPDLAESAIPRTRTVTRTFFPLEHLELVDFIRFGQSSRLFNLFIRQPDVQNRMRALALPRFGGSVQQGYLTSRRVEALFRSGHLTLNQAVQTIAVDNLVPLSGERRSAFEQGVTPAETRFQWFSESHVEALKAGIPFEEINFLNSYQVQAILATFSNAHIEAVKTNIPFEEVKGLTNYQVQAILTTREGDNRPTLTRQDVSGIKLEAIHIEALKKRMSFEYVKRSSALELASFIAEYSNNHTAPEEPKASSEVPVKVALTKEDVKGTKLEAEHIKAIKNDMPFERVKTLSRLQLEALFAGFSETDIEQTWLSDEHCRIVNSKNFMIAEVRGLSLDQLKALSQGYKREQIELLDVGLDVGQLKILLTGTTTIEEVREPSVLSWLQEVKKFNNLESAINKLLVNEGRTLKQIVGLDNNQLTLILSYSCCLEQIANPMFAKWLQENRAYIHGIGGMLQRGHALEAVAKLTAEQLKLVAHYGRTFEQVTDPLCIKLLKENKSDFNIAYLLGTILQRGCSLEKLAELNRNQRKLMADHNCSLEQVTDPICLKLFEENKNEEDVVLNALGSILLQGHALAQIADLNIIQLRAMHKGYTIDQVKNPALIRLCEKFGLKFAWAIDKVIKRGAQPEELENLTSLQLQALDIEGLDLTLQQVQHPNFSRPLLSALTENTHSFEDLINLEGWQLDLIGEGVPFEEATKPNPGMTGLHSIAVLAARYPYPAIRDMDASALMQLLATPYNKLPWAQPKSEENYASSSRTPVALHVLSERNSPSSSSINTTTASSSNEGDAAEGEARPSMFHAWPEMPRALRAAETPDAVQMRRVSKTSPPSERKVNRNRALSE